MSGSTAVQTVTGVLEQVEHLQVAEVRPGDVLVVTVKQALSPQAVERVSAMLKSIWPNTRVLILDQSATLGVVRECSV